MKSISEMLGRVKPVGKSFAQLFNKSFWGNDVTVDMSRSDYDLFKAIYFASVINKKGTEYLLGAGFAKPIINATTAFSIGQGFTVHIEGADPDTPIQDAQDDINQWIGEHAADFSRMMRFGLRGGDSFFVLHDDYSIEFLDPETVTVVYNPLNGKVIGYDVQETISGDTDMDKLTFIRYYRTTGYKVTRSVNGSEPETIIERAFTDEGIVDRDLSPEESSIPFEFDSTELVEVPLPLFHFANDIEPKTIYGISDLQNCLVYFQGYSKVLQEATKSNVYNATPIPYITGDNDKILENNNKPISWGRNIVLYLKGENSKAGFMSVPEIMGDTGKLLELYFYNIVDASETPEFIFGAAIQGSKASVEEQMPIMVKKAQRKQQEIRDVLRKIIDCYIYMKQQFNDENFTAITDAGLKYNIKFPPIVGDDKKLTLDTINSLVELGIISDKTALELADIQVVLDSDKEITNARLDADRRESRAGGLQDPTRVADENNDDDNNEE